MNSTIKDIVDSFVPLTLNEIGKTKLMDRIDTKYIMAVNRVPDLLNMMNGNYQVLEINNIRIPQYYTIYLDTTDYDFFNQHVTGRAGRVKVRFRKYESNALTFLEIKKKTKRDRTVKWRIESNYLNAKLSDSATGFINRHIPVHPELLKPVLSSSFRRITFADFNSMERVTIDFDLIYADPEETKTIELPLIVVAELKSEKSPVSSPFIEIMKKLSVTTTGFSKYCTGLALLYDLPKMNIIKPKILLLNRIENEYNGALSA